VSEGLANPSFPFICLSPTLALAAFPSSVDAPRRGYETFSSYRIG
jgi:hypothetical protein